jgi:tetratricopeptide (TPR) repeat protein
MTELVPTTLRLLADADAAFDAGWLPRARSLYEQVVEIAQGSGERGAEAAGRAMLARCLTRRRDSSDAGQQLERARQILPEGDRVGEARIRAAEVRLLARDAVGDVVRDAVREYLAWAEAVEDEGACFDACLLLADESAGEERVGWYRRAVEHGRAAGLDARLGGTCHALAASLEAGGQLADALDAYRAALELNERLGDRRQVVASRWAVGAVAARLEDWLLAQEHLEAAVDIAADAVDCEDLMALALGDLAVVYQQWGDDIEARRALLRALAIGREIALAQRWPDRWDAMLEQAHKLELDE